MPGLLQALMSMGSGRNPPRWGENLDEMARRFTGMEYHHRMKHPGVYMDIIQREQERKKATDEKAIIRKFQSWKDRRSA